MIDAVRLQGKLAAPESIRGRVDAMLAHRQAISAARGDLDVVAWSYYFLFSDRDRIATVLVAEPLIFAAASRPPRPSPDSDSTPPTSDPQLPTPAPESPALFLPPAPPASATLSPSPEHAPL